MLERAIALTVGALRTVSDGFMHNLMNEPLQKQLSANHLQSIFHRRGVVGVDNGPFKEMAEGLLEHLVPPDPAGLRKWKLGFRREALAALRAFPVFGRKPDVGRQIV